MTATLSGVGADLDVLGLARIRLVDADERDVAAAGRQLGLPPEEAAGPADIVVRYVERLDLGGARQIGLRDAAVCGSDFVLLQGRQKTSVRVALPFDRLGEQPELRCEHGTGSIPLLVPVLNLTILDKGALALHGSAFQYGGTGVVVTGWSKGGKTETLLAFMANGARYIGDEWVYVSNGFVGGLPEPVRVWDWHMRDRPELRRAVPGPRLARVRAVAALHRLGDKLIRDELPGHKAARQFRALTERQAGIDVQPGALFGTAPLAGMRRFSKLLFVESVDRPHVTVEPVAGTEVAARMAASLAYERRSLVAAYHEFRFAFPDRRSRLVEQAPGIEAERLSTMLGSVEAYRVSHPYPVPLSELFDAIRPLIA